MFKYTPYALSLVLLQPLLVAAQNVSNIQVRQAQQTIQNSIKGTLDGVVQMPRVVQNTARQFVFPRSLNNGVVSNPWAQIRMPPSAARQHGYNSVPKGNPWAPVGDTQNIPFDPSNMVGVEKNPYNDSGVPRQMMNMQPQSFGMFNSPYSGYQGQGSSFNYSNRDFNGSNGMFSAPFSNGFFPTNQFWPDGNNGNGSLPFMPW